jgi:hypothetical protein
MCPPLNRLDGYNIFDDKGEVRRLVESLIQDKDPDVIIESIRKKDYSHLFTLSQRGKTIEVELPRAGIEESWAWRKGKIEESLIKRITDTLIGR